MAGRGAYLADLETANGVLGAPEAPRHEAAEELGVVLGPTREVLWEASVSTWGPWYTIHGVSLKFT